MKNFMRSLFLTFILFYTPSAQCQQSNIEDYVALCTHIKTLFSTLYGPHNPLKEHVSALERLINHSVRTRRLTRRQGEDDEANESIEKTLELIKKYGNQLLAQFQFAHPSHPNETHQLSSENYNSEPWNTQDLPTTDKPLITPVKNSSHSQQDQALNMFLQILTHAQTNHPEETSSQDEKEKMKNMCFILGIGGTALFIVYLMLHFYLTPDLRANNKSLSNLKSEYQKLNEVLKAFNSKAKEILPHMRKGKS